MEDNRQKIIHFEGSANDILVGFSFTSGFIHTDLTLLNARAISKCLRRMHEARRLKRGSTNYIDLLLVAVYFSLHLRRVENFR